MVSQLGQLCHREALLRAHQPIHVREHALPGLEERIVYRERERVILLSRVGEPLALIVRLGEHLGRGCACLLQPGEEELLGVEDAGLVAQLDEDGPLPAVAPEEAVQRRAQVVREHSVDQRPLEIEHRPEPGDIRRVEAERRRAARISLGKLLALGVVFHLEQLLVPLGEVAAAVPVHPPARQAQLEREAGSSAALARWPSMTSRRRSASESTKSASRLLTAPRPIKPPPRTPMPRVKASVVKSCSV